MDFGEVAIRLRGELVTCALFSLRLSYSGKAVHRISASAGQEAFFEGHVHAFRTLDGVPAGKIRYDNLKAAVASVIGFSRQRVETDRWTAFRSHDGIEAFYCQPGVTGAHEKGGVEGQFGWFRRNHLVPIPEDDSITELNAMVDVWDIGDEHRRIGARARTVGEHFATEQPLLKPLPTDEFETGRWFTPRVDRYAQITVRMNKYSVPARLVGRQARALLHASELVVYDGTTAVARHERLMTKGASRLELDHYLEVLLRKPGALPGATALEQARAAGRFTPVHYAWWAASCKARRCRWHSRPDRGATAAPARRPRARRRRARHRPEGWSADRRRGRAGSPQARRRSPLWRGAGRQCSEGGPTPDGAVADRAAAASRATSAGRQTATDRGEIRSAVAQPPSTPTLRSTPMT